MSEEMVTCPACKGEGEVEYHNDLRGCPLRCDDGTVTAKEAREYEIREAGFMRMRGLK